MCGNLKNKVKMRVLGPQPNSSVWDIGLDGKLWYDRNGRSGKLSHSNEVIDTCTCSNDDLHVQV